MGKILPVIIALIGLGGGIGTGIVMRPPPEEVSDAVALGDMDETSDQSSVADSEVEEAEKGFDYVKLNNQFVVPVVNDTRVTALVVLSLSLEVAPGGNELIYDREPRIRDAFLQILFDHANSGGFDGVFTNGRSMTILRDALKETAIKTIGPLVKDVLIVDVVRQDL